MVDFKKKSKELYLEHIVKINDVNECWINKDIEFIKLLEDLHTNNVINSKNKIKYTKSVIERRINNQRYYLGINNTNSRCYIKLYNLRSIFEDFIYNHKFDNKVKRQRIEFRYIKYLIFLISQKLSNINIGTTNTNFEDYLKFKKDDEENFILEKYYLKILNINHKENIIDELVVESETEEEKEEYFDSLFD